MGIEQGNPWGGVEMSPEEKKIAEGKRRAAQEEQHGKREDGTYDLDAQGVAEEEDPEAQKAA